MMINLSSIQILQFEITSYCNAKCVHCPRFLQTENDVFQSTGKLHPDLTLSHIDIDAIIENLELAKLTELKSVILEGDKGDPVMHPKLEKLINAFSTMPNPPEIVLTTNGSIRDSSWWANLAKKNYSNLRVIFSIDGLEDTNHLYRVGLDYNTIINNATSFIKHGGLAVWKTLVFKHNEHQIENIKLLSRELGFKMFKAANGHVDRFRGSTGWPVTHENQTWLIEPAEKLYNIEEHFYTNNLNNRPVAIAADQVCPNLRTGQIYINHLNQIVTCCMMHFDTELNYFGKTELLRLMENFDDYNLSKYKLETILGQRFFKNKLHDSLVSGNLLTICKKSCGELIETNLIGITNAA